MTLDPTADLVTLLRSVVDVESVSGNEAPLADLVEEVLRRQPHLVVERDGDCVVARTDLGRDQRIVIAGHLDTVPVADNLPSWVSETPDGVMVHGRGTCDMKGGIAVALKLACELSAPGVDVTWIFYDNEEVESHRNGLGRLARNRPDLLASDLAVLMEPTAAEIEGGCQGTIRVRVNAAGQAAHSARSWMGHNAIHDLADVLARLAAHTPQEVEVEGLVYREGLNAVRIGGGVAGNVIPPEAWVEVNYRYAPDKTAEEALDQLDHLLGGQTCEVLDVSPAARPGLDQPLARAFVAAVGGQARPKYGWTDVARFSALGIPAVNYGPGDPSLAHRDDEHCPASHLERCAQGLRRLLA
ncbi:succinyl-diaminopimelate desuccinylase [Arachnia propionica]|uniref:Succinyl-diaminopimelate desuccinylase n=1 Tax=Arachnia propionica TaxID=1750 RepID=A0A3P1T8Z2_9ACTN|nr:succinyl-diaminopimelate desuccinylase [Arachnia propionica]MDO5082247.1 succinyl-diaminopimelate desuccinylase [Arachnia propionica]RRD05800.1 succinyl-diaminopimelate desuccinylase [Arachnia propionica]